MRISPLTPNSIVTRAGAAMLASIKLLKGRCWQPAARSGTLSHVGSIRIAQERDRQFDHFVLV